MHMISHDVNFEHLANVGLHSEFKADLDYIAKCSQKEQNSTCNSAFWETEAIGSQTQAQAG